jgi:hypothetical protein
MTRAALAYLPLPASQRPVESRPQPRRKHLSPFSRYPRVQPKPRQGVKNLWPQDAPGLTPKTHVNPPGITPVAEEAVVGCSVAAERGVLSPFTTRYLAESGGRLGGTTTRAQNYGISQELRSRGYSFPERPGGGLGSEEFIGGAGAGSKGGTYVDITAIAPNGRTVRIQTIDTLANGLPTPSEAAAAARIRAARPLDKLILVPKGK